MSVKVILVLCAQALFIQTAFGACLGHGAIAAPALLAPGCAGNGWAGNGWIGDGLIGDGWIGNGWAGNGWAGNGWIGDGLIGNGWIGNGCAAIDIIPTSGGALPVSSVSAIAPSGLSVASENVYEGVLSAVGELPFASAVALEGVFPSGGAGAVNYRCGNGITAIESIAPSVAAYGAGAYGAGAYGLGAGYGPCVDTFAPAALGFGYGHGHGHGCGCGLY